MVKNRETKNYHGNRDSGFRGKSSGKHHPPKFSKSGGFKNKKGYRRRSASPKRKNRNYDSHNRNRRRRNSFDRTERFHRKNKRDRYERSKMTKEERDKLEQEKLNDQIDRYWIKGKKDDKIQESLDNELEAYFANSKKDRKSTSEVGSEQATVVPLEQPAVNQNAVGGYQDAYGMNQMQYQEQLHNQMQYQVQQNVYGQSMMGTAQLPADMAGQYYQYQS